MKYSNKTLSLLNSIQNKPTLSSFTWLKYSNLVRFKTPLNLNSSQLLGAQPPWDFIPPQPSSPHLPLVVTITLHYFYSRKNQFKSVKLSENVYLILWKVSLTFTDVSKNEEKPEGFISSTSKDYYNRQTTKQLKIYFCL